MLEFPLNNHKLYHYFLLIGPIPLQLNIVNEYYLNVVIVSHNIQVEQLAQFKRGTACEEQYYEMSVGDCTATPRFFIVTKLDIYYTTYYELRVMTSENIHVFKK